MTVTFQKSLTAALLSGAVAFMTPVLLHAQSTTTTTSGSASGSVSAQPADSSSAKAGANAAGAANTATNPSGTNATTGAYGGMGTDTKTTLPKKKPTTATPEVPDNTPQTNNSMTTQPH